VVYKIAQSVPGHRSEQCLGPEEEAPLLAVRQEIKPTA